MSDWKTLEEFVTDLLVDINDDAVCTPLSGGTKNEEDVMGRSFIVQCKYTDNKNLSILEKDLTRLRKAADMTGKFPIFVSRSTAGTILSIPIDNNTEEDVKFILKALSTLIALKSMKELAPKLDSYPFVKRGLSYLRRLKKEVHDIRNTLHKLVDKVEQTLDTKYDDVTMFNLFEQEK